jgi:putative transposase
MPKSCWGVLRTAQQHAWASRKKQQGKGHEYPLSCLPAETQAHLRQLALEEAITTAGATLPAPPAILTDRQITEREARASVLAALRALIEETGCTQETAIATLLTTARADTAAPGILTALKNARDSRGRRALADDGLPTSRAIKRWITAADLAPAVRQKDMTVPPWATAFLAHWQQPQKPAVAYAYEQARADWQDAGIAAPSIHAVRRFIAKLGAVSREVGRMGPRELKNIRPFVRRDFSDLLPNDIWTADGHCFDAEVQHPIHGRPFRPEITSIVDVATRRCVGWSVALAESSHAVVDALHTAVRRVGMCAIFYVDNGSGYRNVTVSDEELGLMGRLSAFMTHSIPYNSQARGVIERFHKTVWVTGAKTFQSYIGAGMDREAKLESFKITRAAIKHGGAMPLPSFDLFLKWCEEQIAHYNARPHRSLGNKSPDQAWAEFETKGWQPECMDDDGLAALFRPRLARKIARGEVELFGNRYFSKDLEEFHGLKAHVAYDIHDASRVWIHTPEGRLICEAECNGNRRAYMPKPVVDQARERRAAGRAKRLESKAEEIRLEMQGVSALPAPAFNPTLMVGAQTIDLAALPIRAPAEATPAAPARPPRRERPAAENYAEWLELQARQARGETLADIDANFILTWPMCSQARGYFRQHPEAFRGTTHA